MTEQDTKTRQGWLQKGNRKAIAIATGTVIAVSGVIGAQAFAGSKTYAHLQHFASADGGGWGHGGWRGGRHGRLANMSDAEIEAKITRMVKHVAIEIDATSEQQEKITALATAVAKDMKPIRGQMLDAGKRIHGLLVADKIDRDALEKVRAERLAEAERISKNLLNAVADVAEVLTLEQRKVLDERISQFRRMRKGWHRG